MRQLSIGLFFTALTFAQSSVAPTPPMGWNSWDSYGLTVTESEFQANANVLAQKLRKLGWNYAVVDEGWYLQNPEAKPEAFHHTLDEQGRYLPAVNRFPSAGQSAGFKNLANWTHQQNLKFGIHIIRGIPRDAVMKNLPIAGSKFHASEAADKSSVCAWNKDTYGIKANAAGQAYYDSIASLYASWGVDFVKIDCISYPYLSDEIRMFSEALRKTGRPIVLSLSPGPTPVDKIQELRKYANMWRISGDVWDHWQQWPDNTWSQGLLGQFQIAAQWAKYVEPHHWPDADMLPLGYLGPRAGEKKARQSAFSKDEQRTLMTLWSIFRSPLVMGGNLTKLDDETAALLMNPEVIAVDQHSRNGHAVVTDSAKSIWVAQSSVAQSESGSQYVALFNLSDTAQPITFPLQSLGSTSFKLRDVWERKDHGAADHISVTLRPHASALYQLSK